MSYSLALINTFIHYDRLVDDVEEEEHNDNLFARLGRDERTYELHNRRTLDIASLDDDICKALFRFTYVEIIAVATALGLPEKNVFKEGSSSAFSKYRHLALAIMLRRLAYPSRLVDLELLFNIHYSTIGVICNHMIELLYHNYGKGVLFNYKHLNGYNLQRFLMVH